MATAPTAQALPLFYKDLVPLNKQEHAKWHSRQTDKATWLINQHAVPLTVEEFPAAGRHFPIVFSSGDDTVPLALMGMNEGVNVFVGDDGALNTPIYMPAYARRYPFLLARLNQDSEELSLCFDPTSELVGEFDDGMALFDGDQPSDTCKATLDFCEQFEMAGGKTGNFIQEITKQNLLIDGELSIQIDGQKEPLMYRGFRMVDEKKLRDLRGDVLRSWNQNGLLQLIYAHLFSLELVRDIFARQTDQGKVPKSQAQLPS